MKDKVSLLPSRFYDVFLNYTDFTNCHNLSTKKKRISEIYEN